MMNEQADLHYFTCSVLDYVPVGICIIDSTHIVQYWNICMEQWTGITKEEILGNALFRFFPHFEQPQYRVRLETLFAGGPPVLFSSFLHRNLFPSRLRKYKNQIQQITATAISNSDNGTHVLLAVQNVTSLYQKTEQYMKEIELRKKTEEKLEKALSEREFLLKEAHHRIKNNLATVLSIISLESNLMRDEKQLRVLQDIQTRINSISMVHEQLYKSHSLHTIDLSSYLRELLNGLVYDIYNPEIEIEIQFDIEPMELHSKQAISLGLIATEIVTNSLKYAFKGRNRGTISISAVKWKHSIKIIIRDDGIGMSYKKDDAKPFSEESLGLQLIEGLIMQMGGEYTVRNNPGVQYTITIPIDTDKEQ